MNKKAVLVRAKGAKDLLAQVRTALKKKGFTIKVVTDPERALEKVVDQQVGLAIFFTLDHLESMCNCVEAVRRRTPEGGDPDCLVLLIVEGLGPLRTFTNVDLALGSLGVLLDARF